MVKGNPRAGLDCLTHRALSLLSHFCNNLRRSGCFRRWCGQVERRQAAVTNIGVQACNLGEPQACTPMTHYWGRTMNGNIQFAWRIQRMGRESSGEISDAWARCAERRLNPPFRSPGAAPLSASVTAHCAESPGTRAEDCSILHNLEIIPWDARRAANQPIEAWKERKFVTGGRTHASL
jgi:hypothetical protein